MSKLKTTEISVFDAINKAASEKKPIQVGVKLFEANPGNEIQGVFMGLRDISREEMKDPDIPIDNRRKTISTAYIRTSEFLAYRTGNNSAVEHFRVVQPGSYVRLKCLTRGVKDNVCSTFELSILLTPDELAKIVEPYDLISGFIG